MKLSSPDVQDHIKMMARLLADVHSLTGIESEPLGATPEFSSYSEMLDWSCQIQHLLGQHMRALSRRQITGSQALVVDAHYAPRSTHSEAVS
jgi:hypothetical protein